jgi:putative tricarboxylic transport membrane protein
MVTDRIFGAASAVLALLFIVFAVPSITGDWQQGQEARYFTVGPRLFPYIAGILVGVFAALIALRPDGENNIAGVRAPGALRNVSIAIGLSLLFVILLEPLGFIVASALALFGFLVGFRERRWTLIVPIALIAPMAIAAMFSVFFRVTLPTGIFALPF